VVLGALLHDVGKFLHRGDGEYKCAHEEASSRFVEKFSSTGRLNNNKLYQIELVEFLVKHHNPTLLKKEDVLKDPYVLNHAAKSQRIWELLKVIRRADSYSCAERYTKKLEKMSFGDKRAPLDSIFSILNLTGKDSGEKEHCKYHVEILNPMRSFPDLINELPENEIPLLIEDFEKNIPDFSALESFDDVITVWLNLLEKYTWAVPSDTRYETSDVSLFDHLKSSAAIAACLYRRHLYSIDELKKMGRKKEFIFVGGDFSGIQDYIFDITNIGSGGASKRLRARSFFITLFSEATIHKILHSIGLPLLCNLFFAGGKFLLLAPNLEEVEVALQEVKQEIEKEIHKKFFSQFSFLMSWKAIEAFKEEFKIHNFFKVADEMFHQLETEKSLKSRTALLDNDGKWNLNAFKASRLYESYQGNGDCKICGKGPAINKDPETGTVESCDICHNDKFLIGQQLPKTNYVAFGKGYFESASSGKKIVIFDPVVSSNGDKREGYYVELSKKFNRSEEHYLTYQIGEDEKETGIFLNKYVANHVPVDKDENIASFEDISELSRWRKDDKEYGSDLLGVLKADIDNLGLLFSKGIKKSPKDKDLEDV
ncbi:MAG TPA: type III-A CRISPR-associated protein Cas10/Csm1, partial [Nitrospirae bacterium]|nr:type III-A CRISPR-associated protein Cas10/Csm1 [Nitrospirota bacterium]